MDYFTTDSKTMSIFERVAFNQLQEVIPLTLVNGVKFSPLEICFLFVQILLFLSEERVALKFEKKKKKMIRNNLQISRESTERPFKKVVCLDLQLSQRRTPSQVFQFNQVRFFRIPIKQSTYKRLLQIDKQTFLY